MTNRQKNVIKGTAMQLYKSIPNFKDHICKGTIVGVTSVGLKWAFDRWLDSAITSIFIKDISILFSKFLYNEEFEKLDHEKRKISRAEILINEEFEELEHEKRKISRAEILIPGLSEVAFKLACIALLSYAMPFSSLSVAITIGKFVNNNILPLSTFVEQGLPILLSRAEILITGLNNVAPKLSYIALLNYTVPLSSLSGAIIGKFVNSTFIEQWLPILLPTSLAEHIGCMIGKTACEISKVQSEAGYFNYIKSVYSNVFSISKLWCAFKTGVKEYIKNKISISGVLSDYIAIPIIGYGADKGYQKIENLSLDFLGYNSNSFLKADKTVRRKFYKLAEDSMKPYVFLMINIPTGIISKDFGSFYIQQCAKKVIEFAVERKKGCVNSRKRDNQNTIRGI